MARKAAASIAQQERQYHDRMRPYCIITFANAGERNSFGEQFFDPIHRDEIRIQGEIDNKGGGPARDVSLYLNARRGVSETDAYRLTRMKYVSGLIGAGESTQVDILLTETDIVSSTDGFAEHKIATVAQVKDDCYEVVLQYRSVLDGADNVFRTIHPKGIYQTGVSLLPRKWQCVHCDLRRYSSLERKTCVL